MSETDKMTQRARIEFMTSSFNKTEQQEIIKDINDFKNIINTDEISTETIALLIFLYKKNRCI